MVIRAYIDESYAEPRTFALGCALARGTDWTWITRDWKRCIKRKNNVLKAERRPLISGAHAADCNSRHRDFEGWQIAEVTAFTRELLDVIAKHNLRVVGFTVDLRMIDETFSYLSRNPKRTACGVMATLLWREVAAQAKKLDKNPKITVIYESGPFNGMYQDAYNAMRHSDFRDRDIFEGGIRQEEKSHPPLQVADFIAYESMKERDRAEVGRERRLSFQALLANVHGKGLHLGREGLQQAAERFWSILPLESEPS